MKKFGFILILSCITLVLFAKQKIVITELKAAGDTKQVIADSVTEFLSTALADNDKYIVLERSQLHKIYKELAITAGDEFEDSTVIEIGKMARSELILVGTVTKLGGTYIINVRGINIETGNVVFGKSVKAASEDELFDKTVELAAGISGSEKPLKKKEEIYKAVFNKPHKDFPEFDKAPYEAYYDEGHYIMERKRGNNWFYYVSRPLEMDYSKDFVISFRLFYSYGNFVFLFGADGTADHSNSHYFYLSDEWLDYGFYENSVENHLISREVPTDDIKGSEVKIVKEKKLIKIYFNNTIIGEAEYKPVYGNNFLFFVEGRSRAGLEYFKVEYK